MKRPIMHSKRRALFAAAAASAGSLTFGRVLAATPDLVRTPQQALGPFYPSPAPVEQDNDLTRVAGATEPAKGEITFLSGSVFDVGGRPLAGVRVEIWQCDANGRYHHPRDVSGERDARFQGYGTFTTDVAGGYNFKTIRPVPYPGRTPHIHFRISGRNVAPLVTQMYVAGHPQNERDGLLQSVTDRRQRDSLLVPFHGIAGTPEWTARFDIVLATTAG